MTVLLVTVLLTLFISAQCSLYESTLYSVRMGALEAAKARGPRKAVARRMIGMKRNIAEPIAAILILNTLANTAGATIAGMYAHQVLGSQWVPLFSIVFTLSILYISEITPKTLGAVHWRVFWPWTVWPLTVMSRALYPAVWVTQKFSDLVTGKKEAPLVSEEEILGVIRLGAKEGEISRWESDVVQNLIAMEDRCVREVMTPRRVVLSLSGDLGVREAVDVVGAKEFTRLPVYRGEAEDITGYVTRADLFNALLKGSGKDTVADLQRPIEFLEEADDCMGALTSFLRRRRHIAVVQDEFGGVAGVVTLEDLMETMLGTEILDETDTTADLREAARRRGAPVAEFKGKAAGRRGKPSATEEMPSGPAETGDRNDEEKT